MAVMEEPGDERDKPEAPEAQSIAGTIQKPSANGMFLSAAQTHQQTFY